MTCTNNDYAFDRNYNMTRKDIKGNKRGVYFSLTEGATFMLASRKLNTPVAVSPNYEWISASKEDHHEHSPVFSVAKSNIPLLGIKEAELIRDGAICSGPKNGLHFEDKKKMLRQWLVRSLVKDRQSFMPMSLSDDDYTSTIQSHHLVTSIHVLINRHRAKLNIMQLTRDKNLDEIASNQAKRIADKKGKKHSNLNNLISEIRDSTAVPFRRIGENVCGGTSIDDIFEKMMTDHVYVADGNNIFDRRFISFGVGVATSFKGKVYICILFKG